MGIEDRASGTVLIAILALPDPKTSQVPIFAPSQARANAIVRRTFFGFFGHVNPGRGSTSRFPWLCDSGGRGTVGGSSGIGIPSVKSFFPRGSKETRDRYSWLLGFFTTHARELPKNFQPGCRKTRENPETFSGFLSGPNAKSYESCSHLSEALYTRAATVDTSGAVSDTTPPIAHSRTVAAPRGKPFVPGDPRRGPGRAPGSPNEATRIAQELLRAKAIEAVEKVVEVATQPFRVVEGQLKHDPCPLCQCNVPRSEDLQVKAALAILDRTGLGPQSKVEVSQAPDTAWMQYLTDEEFTTLVMLKSASESRMPTQEPQQQLAETSSDR